MRILHTSDWHLGKQLYGWHRYDEFALFLRWLCDTLKKERIDALLIAGDIFDTNTPSNRAQEQYYTFLHLVALSGCRHVVIVGGNHDSPSFLNAPQGLLKALNIHVVGSAYDENALENELLVLRGSNNEPELIVCAVPFLRDKDIRTAEVGESVHDKEKKLALGIHQHYEALAQLAVAKRNALGLDIPIVATGHLFAVGGSVVEGDGTRDLYVGSLGQVHASAFSEHFDYVALGHLHSPQRVNNSEHIRYCGAPIAMGFNESKQQKVVLRCDFIASTLSMVQPILVPCFQRLEQVRGNWSTIQARLKTLVAEQESVWVEVMYEDEALISDLRQKIDALLQDSAVEVLRVQNKAVVQRVLSQQHNEEALAHLSVDDVFQRCLNAHQVPEEQQSYLKHRYAETLQRLHQHDSNAE